MTPETQELLMLKGMVADMGSTEQATIRIVAERIRELIKQNPVATIALAMVALELQVSPERFGLPT
jgi:hypothetical protein